MRKTEFKNSLPESNDHDSNESLASLGSESPNFTSSPHVFIWKELQLLEDSEEKNLQNERQPFSEEPINPHFFREAQQALEFFHSIKNQNTLTPPPKKFAPAIGYHPPVLLLDQSSLPESLSSLPFENSLLSPSMKPENLKQISALVYKQFLKQEYLTYSNLFKRLGVDDGEKRTVNNLKRRMYDVINVLSAAGFISKEGCSLKKIEPLKNDSRLPQILKQEIETKERIQMKRLLKIDCLYKILVLSKVKNQSIETTVSSESCCQHPKISLPLFAINCNTMAVEIIETSMSNEKTSVHIKGSEFDFMGDTNMIKMIFRENTKEVKMITHKTLKIEPNFSEVKME